MSNPLLDLMMQGESGAAGYNAYNRGTYVDDHGGKHIRGPNGSIDFSSLTLGQVHDRQHLGGQDENRLFAVGKYQIIPRTMDGAINALNLDRNQPFTPELQDKIFSQYLIVDKRPDVHDYITGKPGATLHAAQAGLAREWASFGDPANGGASHYPPPNHVSITLAQSKQALNQMRAAYEVDIGNGTSPHDAWNSVMANHAIPVQTRDQRPSSHATDEGVLKQCAHGDAVLTLQRDLNKLGYVDARGHALRLDGDFGTNTRQAVEAFQYDYHLTVDGKAGPQTLATIHAQNYVHASPAALLLDDKRHPDHELYQQALTGVQKIDTDMGRTSDQHSANLAASLTVAAKMQGMTRIDTVVLSENGSRTFAAQNTSPFRQLADVATAQAVHVPIEQSSAGALAAIPSHAETHPQAPREEPSLLRNAPAMNL